MAYTDVRVVGARAGIGRARHGSAGRGGSGRVGVGHGLGMAGGWSPVRFDSGPPTQGAERRGAARWGVAGSGAARLDEAWNG
jgi:hypothetical protein